MLRKPRFTAIFEGAASPDLVSQQARKYGADTSGYIRDGSFVWNDFTSFLAA